MQKSSTVNLPSFFSAPYMATTLPEIIRKKYHNQDIHSELTVASFNNTDL